MSTPSFINNRAFNKGGAICLDDSAEVHIFISSHTKRLIQGNTADGRKNAIHLGKESTLSCEIEEYELLSIYDEFSNDDNAQLKVKGKGNIEFFEGSDLGNTNVTIEKSGYSIKNGNHTYQSLVMSQNAKFDISGQAVSIEIKNKLNVEDSTLKVGLFIDQEDVERSHSSEIKANKVSFNGSENTIEIKPNIRRGQGSKEFKYYMQEIQLKETIKLS
ncbi:MAG: hypothetical protein LBQ04_02025 [Endomicrobium sp.]|jgi:hypothetical protein|nr:hypothetical protein [Endomicrobium sp.]